MGTTSVYLFFFHTQRSVSVPKDMAARDLRFFRSLQRANREGGKFTPCHYIENIHIKRIITFFNMFNTETSVTQVTGNT